MYKLTSSGVQRLADGAFLGADNRNPAWLEYQAWLVEGNTPQPADPPPVPSVVDMAQARLALLQAGLYDAVQAAVAGLPGAAGDAARIEWEFRATVRRDSPLVASLAGALGLTSQQLDDLFTLASTL